MSEIFWDELVSFVATRDKIVASFRPVLVLERYEFYALAVYYNGALLTSCIWLIDWTNIKFALPGCLYKNQRSLYSDHKRFHAFTY